MHHTPMPRKIGPGPGSVVVAQNTCPQMAIRHFPFSLERPLKDVYSQWPLHLKVPLEEAPMRTPSSFLINCNLKHHQPSPILFRFHHMCDASYLRPNSTATSSEPTCSVGMKDLLYCEKIPTSTSQNLLSHKRSELLNLSFLDRGLGDRVTWDKP